MARKSEWQDDYWPLLLQIYLHKPQGVKPTYHRSLVNLSLELHVSPEELHRRTEQIARLDTPRIERVWQQFGGNPQRLARAVRLLRQMNGFGQADEFYDGVEVQETFEKDFRPLKEDSRLTPAKLIIILDLYFQLTPLTMVAETPEVKETAKLLSITPQLAEEVLFVMQHCDPYLNRQEMVISSLLLPCQQIWNRFGSWNALKLSKLVSELKIYFLT